MSHDPQMVEAVARIIRKSREINCSWNDAERLARSVLDAIYIRATVPKNPWPLGTAYGDAWAMGHTAALEASNHAELVEALEMVVRGADSRNRCAPYVNNAIRVLAKTGATNGRV